MKIGVQISDYDIEISEVILVHKCIFEKSYRTAVYKYGRKVSGIVYCISGKAMYDFGGKTFLLEKGQLIFLPASCAYTIRTVGNEPFFHITANFEAAHANGAVHSAFSEIMNGETYASSAENSAYFKDLLERLAAVWHNKKCGYRVLAKSLIYEALHAYFSDAGKLIEEKAGYGRILPAKNHLDEQYMSNISVTELARMCGLSETHFRRLFVQFLGCSPTEYRLGKRMLKAKDMLLSGEFSVAETAAAVGFEDANYFSRIFKSHTGITPSSLRKEPSEEKAEIVVKSGGNSAANFVRT